MKWSRADRYVVFILGLMFAVLAPSSVVLAESYDDTIAKWKSDKDVGQWLEKNFRFDTGRQKTFQGRLKSEGPSAHRYQNPSKLFETKSGYCVDAANFAHVSLGKISPEYAPRWIFIKNALPGKSSHWVTGYTVGGKLYVMDYGAGHGWGALNGIHGPYNSLDDYAAFVSKLNLKGFKLESVVWRDMPGKEE